MATAAAAASLLMLLLLGQEARMLSTNGTTSRAMVDKRRVRRQ